MTLWCYCCSQLCCGDEASANRFTKILYLWFIFKLKSDIIIKPSHILTLHVWH